MNQLHINPDTYIPAAGDVRDLTQKPGESYKEWQARLGENAEAMKAKYPLSRGGREIAHTAMEQSFGPTQAPAPASDEYHIPGSKH